MSGMIVNDMWDLRVEEKKKEEKKKLIGKRDFSCTCQVD